jgi:hypothetical protein
VIACPYGFLLGGMDGFSKVEGTKEGVDLEAGQVARFDRRTQRCVANDLARRLLILSLSQHRTCRQQFWKSALHGWSG